MTGFSYVACWGNTGEGKEPELIKGRFETIGSLRFKLVTISRGINCIEIMDKNISFTLKVWRQKGPKDKGHFDTFQMKDIPGDTSFLEMMDILNEQLINEGKEPIVFDHDCREGICGRSMAALTDILTDLLQVPLPARFVMRRSKTVIPCC